ncbi:MAG: hypothetical protein IIB00_00615 [candidate division Zixibacteria bacterium]|nr:hypothetical protein [candidate division Zixibacteria bacterium]
MSLLNINRNKNQLRRSTSNVSYTVLSLAAFLLLGGIANAQDPGIRDTVTMFSVDVNQGDHFGLPMKLFNDEDISAATLGFSWGTGDLFLDSISYVGTRTENTDFPQIKIDNVGHTVLTGFADFGGGPLPAGDGLFATLWFTVGSGASDQFIEIDSVFIPPAGPFILIGSAGNETIVPEYVMGIVKIGNPSEPPTIAVSPDSLYFEALEGPFNPPSQSINISNIGLGTLNWSASVSSGWLNVSPLSGVAPSLAQVSANSIGLSAGVYHDTIVISDPTATNNPFLIPVVLQINIPPPVISLSQTEYFFNAIADSSNPMSQTLIVKNVGDGNLNWSSSNNESWLTLTPSSGGDSTDVSLDVDIFGLPFGEYDDTIVISDPEASNNPVTAIVHLSVASDLPIIDPDPDTLIIVVDLNDVSLQGQSVVFDSAYFWILNEGAGTMSFEVSETSSLISTLTPTSGTAPDSVVLTYRITDNTPGDIFDTIWVASPQAINSPQPLIVRFHMTFSPASIIVSPDTISFSLFECEQGNGFVPQLEHLTVSSTGDAVDFGVSFDSDWLEINKNSSTTPDDLIVTIDITGLPVGDYYETVRIDAPLATNTPQFVIAHLEVTPGTLAPLILPSRELFVIPARENSNFQYCPIQILEINNFHGGCFDWEIVESVNWLTIEPLSGQNPAHSSLVADGTDYTFGIYDSVFVITSPTASNSPRLVNVSMRVWRLFGDANYDNQIDVSDAVYLIKYIFNSGPPPEPAIKIGDTNCTTTIDVSDALYLIRYIFRDGDAPCGNPQ